MAVAESGGGRCGCGCGSAASVPSLARWRRLSPGYDSTRTPPNTHSLTRALDICTAAAGPGHRNCSCHGVGIPFEVRGRNSVTTASVSPRHDAQPRAFPRCCCDRQRVHRRAARTVHSRNHTSSGRHTLAPALARARQTTPRTRPPPPPRARAQAREGCARRGAGRGSVEHQQRRSQGLHWRNGSTAAG